MNASNTSIFDDHQLAEWATRAFFLYGGQRTAGIGLPVDMHSGFSNINPGAFAAFPELFHTVCDANVR